MTKRDSLGLLKLNSNVSKLQVLQRLRYTFWNLKHVSMRWELSLQCYVPSYKNPTSMDCSIPRNLSTLPLAIKNEGQKERKL